MSRGKLQRESSSGSMGQNSKPVVVDIKLPAPPEDHEVVESDDDELSADELEWGLGQRATDPYFKQRKQKGRFIFIKIAGCEGFHCYEHELIGRLQEHGVCVDLGSAPIPKSPHSADGSSTPTVHAENSNSSNGSQRRVRHSRHSSKQSSSTDRKEATAAVALNSGREEDKIVATATSNSTRRKQWQKPTDEQ